MSQSTEANIRQDTGQDKLSRSELIQNARRLACEHIENAKIPESRIDEALQYESSELAISRLAGVTLYRAFVEISAEES